MLEPQPTTGPFFDDHHDHARCVVEALERAEVVCSQQGARLTELRRRVLELVWQMHRPVGAYDLIELLAGERGRVAPPTVYRALDFLREHGLVHRIDSLNAFIGCARPDTAHDACFLICRACRNVAELSDPALDAAIDRAAGAVGFEPTGRTVELAGYCRACREGTT